MLEAAATGAGHVLDDWCPAVGETPPRPLDAYAALVVLGGGQNVVDRDRLPFLARELELVADWHASDRPLLGICLGAQLLAHATGGAVVRASRPEIGWLPVERVAAGDGDPLLGFGPASVLSYHWHSYAVHLPQSAVELARTDVCTQAFRLRSSWGVQFHPEVTPAIVAEWTADWQADQDAVAMDFDPRRATAEAAAHLPSWARYGRELFGRFCALVA